MPGCGTPAASSDPANRNTGTSCRRLRFGWCGLLLALSAWQLPAAEIEFLDGGRLTCRTLGKTETHLLVELTQGGKKETREIPLAQIHAVSIDDKRYVLNERTVSSGASGGSSDASVRRTRAEIAALIQQQGRTPPDWYNSTPLVYPDTLDLSWPQPPPKGWDNQRNVGQYIWDIINPNPGKWREGTRFVHHLLKVNQRDPQLRDRIMNELGRCYHDLLEDYGRAAFWWQHAGVDTGRQEFGRSGPHLAACYYRLGNKQMAVELLNKLPAHYSLIKVWGEIGEPRKAVQLAETYVRGGGEAWTAYMYAGDAYRTNGQFSQALRYYQKVLDAPVKDEKREQRNRSRAESSIEAIKLFELSDINRVPDGVYESSAMGYETQVAVAVTVKNHRIESVEVTRHREKQFYSALTDTPAKILLKQGVKGVDATSSATITSEAIINATAKALASSADR